MFERRLLHACLLVMAYSLVSSCACLEHGATLLALRTCCVPNSPELRFFDIGDLAASHLQKTKCCNQTAWEWALASTSSSAARKRHPVSNLEVVLAEYVCMTSSDSIIERDFSRLKLIMGDHRLTGKDGFESDMAIILLSDPEHDDLVINGAMAVWSELYPGVRTVSTERIDKGVRRKNRAEKGDDLVSEQQWLKQRRVAVGQLAEMTPPVA